MKETRRPRSLCDVKLLSITHSNGVSGKLTTDHVIVRSLRNQQAHRLRESWPNTSNTLHQEFGPLRNDDERAVSMAGLVNTTVPQRLVTRPIRGQHTPTRHSLRHSRMISLIHQGKVPRKYLPPVIHQHKLGTFLVSAQVVLGTWLISLALYLLLWNPHLRLTDVPYWSGTPLVLSGVFGVFLICCCRKQYPGMRGGCCVFAVKVQYIICSAFLAMAASAACLCACVFAGLHVSLLYQMNCSSEMPSVDGIRNSTCICRLKETFYTYDPLNCDQVQQRLVILLLCSSVVNAMAVFVCIFYILVIWGSRYSYTYAGIKSAEQKAAVMSSLYY